MDIKFQGAIYNCSGYAQIRHIFLELSKRHQVRIEPFRTVDNVDFLDFEEYKKLENTELRKPYINVVSGIGPQIRRDYEAAYNIAYSMFETYAIPETWIPFYNEFDEIWTPSNFCKKAFNVKEINCSVQVIPLGFDDKIFTLKKKEKKFFTFLSVGKWIDRKGWDLLINAYTSEFVGNNEVRLCIKTDNECKTAEEMVKEYLTTDRTSHMPRILVNNKKISEMLMSEIYSEADCYIAPSRGEAFGLTQLEAMASGVPVITSDFGGVKDFVNENNGWLIPINTLKFLSERICKINAGYKNLWFAEPEIKDIRKIMRYVYEHKNEVAAKSLEAIKTAENFTWSKVAEIAKNRLKEIYEKIN